MRGAMLVRRRGCYRWCCGLENELAGHCCRRLAALTLGAIAVCGLTPAVTCCRCFAACWCDCASLSSAERDNYLLSIAAAAVNSPSHCRGIIDRGCSFVDNSRVRVTRSIHYRHENRSPLYGDPCPIPATGNEERWGAFGDTAFVRCCC